MSPHGKLIKFDTKIASIANDSNFLDRACECMYDLFYKVSLVYKRKYGFKILLVVDQINAIVAEYRIAQNKFLKAKLIA